MGYEEALRLIEEAKETGATELNLSMEGLTELPPQLFQLSNLTGLNIGYNELFSLPPELFQLSNLTELYLIGNQLSSLPPELFQLTNLITLDLRINQLSSLPPELGQLTKLETLWLEGNPLTSPPYELAVQGIEAIREYFTSAEEGTRTVSEVKVILVGEGASGKTSLTRCLREERFNQHEETTHGIRIKPWQLDTKDQSLRCNLWDFGGQEIMHATHP
ncbi:MAG: GTPase, partial [Candidatus Electrothrix sp. MAN1_4]|nr:GTPase [Candidatus Electrothrix sp. MAN1_4]